MWVMRIGSVWRRGLLGAGVLLAGGAAIAQTAERPRLGLVSTFARWPRVEVPPLDPAVEARVDALLARISVEDKVGQVVQPDIASFTPADMTRYRFGSYLAGGNSGPGNNDKAPAPDWLKLADAMWDAAMRPRAGGAPAIPSLFGIDAVHGHANVVGATIFPQNIGLGAARDPDLIRRIGAVTAAEMAVTGLDWDFSPTLAVVRNDRWGRSYEGFSEDPSIVASYAGAMVEGLQGVPGTPEYLRGGKVIATAKHFVGDGGTRDGVDQGDTPATPAQLRDIHGAGYPPAIRAGAQAVMASFSGVNGTKVTGDRSLLTGVLRNQMGFDGLVVGDWNAHGQVPGCTNTSCPQAFNAGLDMFMAPETWRGLHASTLAQVRSGAITTARLDEAVRRILRVKVRAGLFEKGRPSSRPLAGRFELLGSADHRAVAREAVRKSLVLLKNNGGVLPLSPKLNLLVAGDGADNVAKQAGGWTVTWQGTGVGPADLPKTESIWSGLKRAVEAGGGRATLSPDGRFQRKPDAAIVVFGEEPYAEFAGDRPNVAYKPGDTRDLELMKRLKAQGIPVVAVFLSGRPMWVNPELNAADAFVAAFLPGGEGGGVADLLIGDASGRPRHDFTGRLSFSWPKRFDQAELNRGDRGYDPLFPFGYGLDYRRRATVPVLAEDRPPPVAMAADGSIFDRGRLPAGWSFALADRGRPDVAVVGNAGATATGGVRIAGADRAAQEDARAITFGPSGGEARIVASAPIDLSREANGGYSLRVEYRVDRRPAGAVRLGSGAGSTPITDSLRSAPVGEWRQLQIPLRCLVERGMDPKRVLTPFTLASDGSAALTVSQVRWVVDPNADAGDC
jgi:beta-glucosidase